MLPARTIIVIAARISQPTASSNAAHVIASTPIRVRVSPWSARIRARTGNAVMLIADPMKSANGNSATPSGAYGCQATTATALPSANGTAMLTMLVTSAIRPTVFSVSISSRQPTRNMNSATPTCPSTLSAGSDAAGKSSADTPGATQPSSEGPSMSPATISAMTGGWPSHRAMGVARRDRARMTAT